MEAGNVFRIQRFCLHDGDGIRTNVFLCTCPLNCIWCHNPECRTVGEKMTVDDVMHTVRKDLEYYRSSGGGMTLSGGEPSAQAEFSLALLRAAKEDGIPAAMETAGCGTPEFYQKAAELGCVFLYDLKVIDREKHLSFCGQNNDLILENLKMLAAIGADLRIRMPLIPGCNDDEDNTRQTAGILKQVQINKIELMPYHNTARGKYAAQGSKPPYDRDNATAEEIAAASARFTALGIAVSVSGE